MEYAALILAGAAQQLKKLFDLGELQDVHSLQNLQAKVTQAVLHMLRSDLSRLLNILYRIDVDERLVKEAMQAPTENVVADLIAHLIIKRELQKAQTRFIYRSN